MKKKGDTELRTRYLCIRAYLTLKDFVKYHKERDNATYTLMPLCMFRKSDSDDIETESFIRNSCYCRLFCVSNYCSNPRSGTSYQKFSILTIPFSLILSKTRYHIERGCYFVPKNFHIYIITIFENFIKKTNF